MAPFLFLALVGIAIAYFFRQLPSLFAPVIVWRERRRYKARLRKAASTELLAEARAGVRRRGWQRFRTGKTLLVEAIPGDALLRDLLTQLLAEVTEEDRERNRRGRESNEFEFCESGLNLVLEALEERLLLLPSAGPFR